MHRSKAFLEVLDHGGSCALWKKICRGRCGRNYAITDVEGIMKTW